MLFHFCSEQQMHQVCDVKVRGLSPEVNSKQTEISLWRAHRRKDSQGLNWVYSFVFVKIYPYVPLLCLLHSFSLWVEFQDNLAISFPFVFILVLERSNYRIENQTGGSGKWESSAMVIAFRCPWDPPNFVDTGDTTGFRATIIILEGNCGYEDIINKENTIS